VSKKGKAEPAAGERAAQELVRRAREQGLSLTGPDGPLKQPAKAVLKTALDQETAGQPGPRAQRPGRQRGGQRCGPPGPARRLQRGATVGWAVGYAVIMAACGAAAEGIGELLGTGSAVEHEFTRLGGQAAITNAYLASLMLLAGLAAAGYATSASGHPRCASSSAWMRSRQTAMATIRASFSPGATSTA
jgi:hypothetical protein